MKKILGKVLILLFALSMIFTAVGCKDTKKKPETEEPPEEESVGKILNDALVGINGLITQLKNGTEVLHIELEAFADITPTKGDYTVKDAARYSISIKGNFNTIPEKTEAQSDEAYDAVVKVAMAKNDAQIIVKDVIKNINKIAIYVKDGVVYFEESLLQATVRRYQVSGIKALEINKYLAKIPAELTKLLGNFAGIPDISDMLAGMEPIIAALINSSVSEANGVKTQTLGFNLEGLSSIIGILESIDIEGIDMGKILDIALPILFGYTLPELEDPDLEKVYPEISLAVSSKDNVATEIGLKYHYDRPTAEVADSFIDAGIRGIKINTESVNVVDIDTTKYSEVAVVAELDAVVVAKDITLKPRLYLNPSKDMGDENYVIAADVELQLADTKTVVPANVTFKLIENKFDVTFDLKTVFEALGINEAAIPAQTKFTWSWKPKEVEPEVKPEVEPEVKPEEKPEEKAGFDFMGIIGLVMDIVPAIMNNGELDSMHAFSIYNAIAGMIPNGVKHETTKSLTDAICLEIAKIETRGAGDTRTNEQITKDYIEKLTGVKITEDEDLSEYLFGKTDSAGVHNKAGIAIQVSTDIKDGMIVVNAALVQKNGTAITEIITAELRLGLVYADTLKVIDPISTEGAVDVTTKMPGTEKQYITETLEKLLNAYMAIVKVAA